MTYPPDSGSTGSSDGGDSGWGAPDSSGYATPGGGAGGYAHGGQYGQPGQYGGPGQPGGLPPETAYIPAQPGIIPLHPLRLGQIFDGAFKAIRANPTVMFVFAAIVVVIATTIETVLSASFFRDYFSLLNTLETSPEAAATMSDDDILSMFSGSFVPLLVGSFFTFIGTTILNGVLTLAVSQAVLGFKPGLGQVWDQAKGQILRLLGLVLAIGVITVAVPALLVGLIVLSSFSGSTGVVILMALLAMIGTVVWLLFIMAATALATPALMLERSGVFTALRRSWRLVKPFFWRVLGIYLLTSIIAAAVVSVIAMPASVMMFFLPPTGYLVAQGIASAVASTLITPFTAAVLALLYIDIRIRREGLAAELAAASQ